MSFKCEECGADVPMAFEDKDRGFNWCRRCSLVIDPNHPMSRGISGLMAWLRIYNVSKGDMRHITALYVTDGLKSARLASIPIVEGYLARKIS